MLGRLPLLHQAPVVSLLSAFGRRWLPLPAAPFSQTSLPSPGPKVSVGPRFECLQTKRCALLWSVSYPCSIFHALASRLFNASASIELQLPYRCPLVQEPEDSFSSRPLGRFPSSSAPAFSPARSLTQVPGSVRVTTATSQHSQFLQLTVPSSPFLAYQLALGDSQVWSQPLSSIYAGSHRACGIC